MTSALLSDRPHIARVRVRTAGRDALEVSLRAGALLERVDLRPPSLPRASILLIRSLRDPLPGCVSLARPSEIAPARWQQALTANLARLALEAARPALGPVPASAAAVLFADELELVACLVRDWLRGSVADGWWWRSVLGDLSPQQWLRKYVLARGEALVPVIALLAPGRDTAAWLGRLPDLEAEEALAAIARSYAVSLGVPEDKLTPPRRRAGEGRARDRLMDIETDRRAALRSAAFERLIATVPESRAPELRPPQRRLLALALALARAPSWARTSQFALALQALDRGGALAAAREPASRPVAPQDAVTRLDERASASSAIDVPTQSSAPPAARDRLAAGLPEPELSAAITQVKGLVLDKPAAPIENAPPAPDTKPAIEQATSIEHASRVRTKFGGIFYLLNAALALKLYADFTSPRGSNLRISPWDWLALIGRGWFGREFVRDPAWKLLAGLAGRERRYLRRPRWLEGQIERLLARLALALGKERWADMPAFVCRYRAEVVVTASRVDVHLALADLPLALRVAGLDRDPGWVPAAGRSIAFHFE